MKKIQTHIPEKDHKHDYLLMHLETYGNILAYLDEIELVAGITAHEFIDGLRNEMEWVRKL